VGVILPRGGNLRLATAAPGIERVRVELGWRGQAGGTPAVELDGVIVIDRVDGTGDSPEALLAHQTPNPAEGAASPATPARPGAVRTETLVVTLSAVPAGITGLRLGAAIFDATARRQTFRLVDGPYIRVCDEADGAEIARHDVTPETGQETAMIFGELYRHAGGWKFRAVGQGYANGLLGLAATGHEVALARPADVAAFVTRSSPTRSRRRIADHLRPPLFTGPANGTTAAGRPAAARPAPQDSSPQGPSAQRPSGGGTRPGQHGPVFSRPPATPRPPAGPPRPVLPAPPAPSRPPTWSPLDLDGPPTAASGPSAPPAGSVGGRPSLDLGGQRPEPADGRPPAPSTGGRSSLDLGGEPAESPGAVPPAGSAAGRSSLDLGGPPPATAPPTNRPAGGGSALDLGGDARDRPAGPGQAAGGSALDLGGGRRDAPPGHRPGEPARDLAGRRGEPGAPASDGRGGSVVFGERSGRYRQRLEHVTALADDHPATAWTAEKRGSGSLTVTLRWTPLTTRTGLPRPSDLQLGCLWQSLDGSAGVLQTLGGATSAPGAGAAGRRVLALTPRDEREGQKMFVDLRALATFKRFFVFAYGLHGAPEWDLLRPELTVESRTGENLEIRLGEAPAGARTCVVASFHIAQDDLVIRRENDFLPGPQAEAAARYGWVLDWTPDGMTLRDR